MPTDNNETKEQKKKETSVEREKRLQEEIAKLKKEQLQDMGLLESAQKRMLANDQRSFDILKKAIELDKEGALNAQGRNELAEALGITQDELNKKFKNANKQLLLKSFKKYRTNGFGSWKDWLWRFWKKINYFRC